MGWQYPPLYGKSKEFYAKKIKEIDTKIAKLEKEKKICLEELKKDEK